MTVLLNGRPALPDSLGIETSSMEIGGELVATYVPSDPMTMVTSLPGVYVAGNVTAPQAQVIMAAGDGVKAAAQINMRLVTEDADALVSA